MAQEKMKSILSKMKEELLNSVEEEAAVEDDEEDGELSPGVKNIMNGVTEMLWETIKPCMNPNAGKSLTDVVREAAENEEEQE